MSFLLLNRTHSFVEKKKREREREREREKIGDGLENVCSMSDYAK